MKECIFCKIIGGEVPAEKLYEDEQVLVFLDINPVNPGHSLVIPKNHIDEFQELDAGDYQAVMGVVKRLSQRVKAELGPVRVGLMVHGFEVPHAHIHVIPMQGPDDLGVSHKASASESELTKIAEQLRFN